MIASVGSGRSTTAVAIDEDTVLVIDGDTARVDGLGRVHVVSPSPGGVRVRSFDAGTEIDVDFQA